jgi:tetratricopeptide (TPR) repeat protein
VGDYIRREPASYGLGLGRKILHLVSSRELPRTLDVYLHRKWSSVLSVLTFKIGAWGFPFGALFPLAAVGFVMSWRKIPAPLVIMMLIYGGTLVFVFVSARYRTPLVPLFAMLAAEGAVSMVRLIRTHRWRSLSLTALVMVASISISTLPGPFAQETVDLEPELHFGVGINYYRQQRWDDAATHLRRASELDPEMAGPHKFLGITLAEMGRYEEGEEHLAEALRLKPDDQESRNNLRVVRRRWADFHFREGRGLESENPAAAVQHYTQALVCAPDWPEPLARLAWMRATARIDSLRDGSEAIRLARLARTHLGRDDSYLLFVLAAAHAEFGDFEAAIAIAERAVESALAVGNADLANQVHEGLIEFRLGKPRRQ